MLGAIIGDVVGSRFEFNNIKTKDFEFFSNECFFTDDTVMTIAVAKALIKSKKHNFKNLEKETIKQLRIYGNKYPFCSYGANFRMWLQQDNPQPYYSYGNGSAMRVSACGYVGKTLEEVQELAERVSSITHSHPEGIKGAKAVASIIYLLKQGNTKEFVKDYIQRKFYDLNFTIDEIRPHYRFNESCQGTVPQAIMCFLESRSFEDAIRIGVSIGGDSDTLCAIIGQMAEAYYRIPPIFIRDVLGYLDYDLTKDVNFILKHIKTA